MHAVSSYRDFVLDLPQRSIALLNDLLPRATAQGREVTLLLMAASTAFVVPLERLNSRHPSQDAKRFSEIANSFAKSMSIPFATSPFFPKGNGAWLHGRVSDFGEGPDAWIGDATALGNMPASYVFAVIRNALAHGNLYTKGDPIDELVLYAEVREGPDRDRVGGYKYLVIPVATFQSFLLAWFAHVSRVGLPYREALRALARVA